MNQLKIREYYQGKTILITGCTGFLGKVVLEKLLRAMPNIKKIYVLVRPKAGVSAMERVKKEIFQSQCFDLVRKQHPNFMAFIESIIEPIEGDIAEDPIILNPLKMEEIKNTVNIIINNAASIDFNLRIDQALQINYFGPRRILDLAKQCSKLEVFTHISTCYVNSDKRGYIDEKIYDFPNDPDEIVDSLLKVPVQNLVDNVKDIIKPWVNTYTFTKNLSERSLQKHRGNVPLVILRPSIIIGATTEPLPGWGDSMAAAGPITILYCIGLCRYLEIQRHSRSDLIPVDIVSNQIIIATAAQANNDNLTVLNAGTSHANPNITIEYINYCIDYCKTSPFENTFNLSRIIPTSKKGAELGFYLESLLPAKAMLKFAKVTRNQTMQKNAERLFKLYDRWYKVNNMFFFFVNTDWCFESKQIFNILDRMDPEEQMLFNGNPKTIDWKKASVLYVYGMQKYIYKMDVSLPFFESSQLINRNSATYFEDIQTTMEKGSKLKHIQLSSLFNQIIRADRVQSTIRDQLAIIQEKKGQQGQPVPEAEYRTLLTECRQYLKDVESEINPRMLKIVFWIFHKQFKKFFEQIVVADTELVGLKTLIDQKKHSVVLVPSYKSYLDFILLSYVHTFYGIDLPFITALRKKNEVTSFDKILKKCGGIFFDDRHHTNPLYKEMIEEYLAQILKNQYLFEYHIERKRERSGKLMKPAEFIFENLVTAYLRNQNDIKDLVFVPITINYEKIYEGEQFPFELLGESKQEELPGNFFNYKQLLWIAEKHGRVNIKYCKPISIKDIMQTFASKHNLSILGSPLESIQLANNVELNGQKKQFCDDLAKEIVYTLSDNQVIMSTSLVASMLLVSRKSGINEEDLLKRITWLYHQIQARNGLLGITVPPSATIIKTSLKYLGKNIERTNDVFKPQVKAQFDYKSLLMLAYYRNNLVHLFVNEAYIACALKGFGEGVIDAEGVPAKRLWEQTSFLVNILKDEFMVRNQIETKEQFQQCLEYMRDRGFITMVDGIVKITKEGDLAITYLSSLLYSFIESYWVTLSFLSNMDPSMTYVQGRLEQRIQSLAESLYDEGYLLYYECCSLESIGNAVSKFKSMGILSSQVFENIHKNTSVISYEIPHEKAELEVLKSVYERLTFFKPVVAMSMGVSLQEDVKRLLSTQSSQPHKL